MFTLSVGCAAGKADPNKLLPYIINEINTIRPNGSLNGLIPLEAYNGIKPPTYDSKKAQSNRRLENSSFSCGKCPV